jgi:hypothetical protein
VCNTIKHAAALLRSLQENTNMQEFIIAGWDARFDLCNGPASTETEWTGVTCVDSIFRPGVVAGM